MAGAEPEEGLEGGVRVPATFVAEDELVQIRLEVSGTRATVGAVWPGLEIRDRCGPAGTVVADRLDPWLIGAWS